MAKARVASKHPHVQKTLTHLGDHKHQPETPSTVAVVPSDSSDTHFACDATIDVYKYGHSKRIYRYQYQWLWAKFRQRHVNLPKLLRGNVWNSDGDIKTPPNRASMKNFVIQWSHVKQWQKFCKNFQKSFLECEKKASRKMFQHFFRAHFFMFVLLISNHTTFSCSIWN